MDERNAYNVNCEDGSVTLVRMPEGCTCKPLMVLHEKVLCSGIDACPVHGLHGIEEEPGFPWEVVKP